ncbi:MAG: hypothetical protein K0B09_10470 [Bacteroidales bacterium]|nr:hypothetical protein [Bacteroidales bacterium]
MRKDKKMVERIRKTSRGQGLAILALLLFIVFFPGASGASAQIASAPLPGKVTYPVIQHAGSPYFLEDWTRGEVLLNNGRRASGVLLRYDGHADRLLWRVESEANKQVEIDKYLVKGFMLSAPDTSYHFSLFDVSSLFGFVDKRVFMQVLQQGSVSLLAFRGVRLTSRLGYLTDHQGRARQALTLVSEPKYYLQFPDGTIKRINLRRRSFIQAIEEQLPGSWELLRGQNPRFRTEAQMAHTVYMLNNLSGK